MARGSKSGLLVALIPVVLAALVFRIPSAALLVGIVGPVVLGALWARSLFRVRQIPEAPGSDPFRLLDRESRWVDSAELQIDAHKKNLARVRATGTNLQLKTRGDGRYEERNKDGERLNRQGDRAELDLVLALQRSNRIHEQIDALERDYIASVAALPARTAALLTIQAGLIVFLSWSPRFVDLLGQAASDLVPIAVPVPLLGALVAASWVGLVAWGIAVPVCRSMVARRIAALPPASKDALWRFNVAVRAMFR